LAFTITEIINERLRSVPITTPETEVVNNISPERNDCNMESPKTKARVWKATAYLEKLNSNGFTTQPVALGKCNDTLPEFGRFQDVQRLFGIKRASLYLMVNQGLIKSISLRREGQLKGVRLFHLQSISDYLNRLLEEQNGRLEGDH